MAMTGSRESSDVPGDSPTIVFAGGSDFVFAAVTGVDETRRLSPIAARTSTNAAAATM
jgi:hypothetical protein